MKKFTLYTLYFIGFIISLGSCTSYSNITIPPYQQFVLGELEQSAFKVELTNLSDSPLEIETRNQSNEKTSGFGFSPKGKTKLGISADERAIIRNPNANKVIVRAKLSKGVEGMRYEAAANTAQIRPTITDEDLKPIVSKAWKGKLTYMDYSSNKKVSIPCNLSIEHPKENSYLLKYSFPDEPQANSSSKFNIGQKGQVFAGQQVMESKELEDGTYVIKTIEEGKDDGKKAILFHTYTFTQNQLSIKKEYQGLGSAELKFRNEFSFKK